VDVIFFSCLLFQSGLNFLHLPLLTYQLSDENITYTIGCAIDWQLPDGANQQRTEFTRKNRRLEFIIRRYNYPGLAQLFKTFAWAVKEGVISLDPKEKDGRGDIVSDKEYENFELAIDWNISEEGNSGIMFIVHEDKAYENTYTTGPEYQLLDDKKAEDNKQANHLAGSLYDIIAPVKPSENPAGQWNHTVIRLQNGELTFWLNGVQTVKTHLWDATWKELVAKSKFKSWKGFAEYHKGHISLQDHGYHISFRNIKIREL